MLTIENIIDLYSIFMFAENRKTLANSEYIHKTLHKTYLKILSKFIAKKKYYVTIEINEW